MKKKKIIIIITSIVVVALLVALAFILVAKENNKERFKKLYYEDVEEMYDNLKKSYSELTTVDDDVQKYWHEAIWDDKFDGDINVATQQALDDNFAAALEISSLDIKIKQAKKTYNLSYTDEEIDEAIKQAYKDYYKLYSFIEDFSGYNYDSFTDEYKDLKSDFKASLTELELVL